MTICVDVARVISFWLIRSLAVDWIREPQRRQARQPVRRTRHVEQRRTVSTVGQGFPRPPPLMRRAVAASLNEPVMSAKRGGDEHEREFEQQYLPVHRRHQALWCLHSAPAAVCTSGEEDNQRERGGVRERLNEHCAVRMLADWYSEHMWQNDMRCHEERDSRKIENLRLPHSSSASGIVTLGIGVAAQQPTTSSKSSALVEAAERVLYGAKKAGRNRVS
ncbi:diguanylate cyclase [Burkholderia sp. BT03]|nr:diguanylate cyclase [Burkholderia sp. BT03]